MSVQDLMKDVITEQGKSVEDAHDLDPNEILNDLLEDEVDEVEDDFEDEIEDEEDNSEFDDEEFEVLEADEDEEDVFEKPKRTQEQKEQYAFAQLRAENAEKQREINRLNEVAINYGFKNHTEMIEKLEEDKLTKTARDKGHDPEIYKELSKTQKELEQIKQERAREKENALASKFLDRIDGFVDKHNLSAADKAQLISKLDEDGFTINELSRIKNYENLFSGYANETINERKRQQRIKRDAERSKLAESKYNNTGIDEEVSMDTLIDNMLKSKRSKY